MYSAVAHAINNLKEPDFAYEQSWDGDNYSYHFGSGRGTIAFDLKRNIVAGAHRAEDSERNSWYPGYDAMDLFTCDNQYVKQLATNETLEYLYDTRDGVTKPVATIAFWIDDNDLYLSDNGESFRLHGGEFLLDVLLLEPEDIKQYWKEQYHFGEEEAELVEYVYRCIVAYKPISKRQVKKLINRKQSGYKECLESLKEMNGMIK